MSVSTPAAPAAVKDHDFDQTPAVPVAGPKKRNFKKYGWGSLAFFLALLWAFPIYWMVNSSFLTTRQIQGKTPQFIATDGTIENFKSAFADGSLVQAFKISLGVTGLTLLVALVFAFLAAIAVSRFRFRGRKSFIVTILIVQMIPAEGMFIAQYKMLDGWNLVNSIFGLTIVYIATILPFTIWMLRGFVAGIPADLEEAAMVDGLSRTGAFFRITFPLLAPGLVAAGVYGFLQAWNEYTLALVVMSDPGMRTVPLWLQGVSEQATKATDWGMVMASSTVIAIPVIVFFLFVQNKMTSGLVAGAVKG